MSDSLKDAYERMGSDTKPVTQEKDPRILIELGSHGRYRAVAPDARRREGRLFVNGKIIIEKRGKDSLGVETWTAINEIARPTSDTPEADSALYWLLAGRGAE